ncbi:hypothetical protein BDR04DRAFT_1101431 [Suillus decipiens]|nr:hypothetical protein BDR04DRAFT_1101431 [Suillus decipiens]
MDEIAPLREGKAHRPVNVLQQVHKTRRFPPQTSNEHIHSAPLNHHLHRIGKIDSPRCPFCPEKDNTVHHYLLDCPQYVRGRHILNNSLRRQTSSIAFFLTSEQAIAPLMRFVNSTERSRPQMYQQTNIYSVSRGNRVMQALQSM